MSACRSACAIPAGAVTGAKTACGCPCGMWTQRSCEHSARGTSWKCARVRVGRRAAPLPSPIGSRLRVQECVRFRRNRVHTT